MDGSAPFLPLDGERDHLGQLHVETVFSSCQLSYYFPDARWQKSSERLQLRWLSDALWEKC